jgi:hypothetical protein
VTIGWVLRGVTSHDDGVVDQRPDVGDGCRCWYTRGDWTKREAEAMRGADEDTDDDIGATRGVSGDARAAHGTGEGTKATHGIGVRATRGAGVDVGAAHGADVDVGAGRGAGWGDGAALGMATVSKVPATKEG